MESLKKLLKYLLQPWSTIVHFRISSIAKATIVGCAASLTLWALGWTLFASPVEENMWRHRSVFSILVSPDNRTIKAQPAQQSVVGECSYNESRARVILHNDEQRREMLKRLDGSILLRRQPQPDSLWKLRNLNSGQLCGVWKSDSRCNPPTLEGIFLVSGECQWTATKYKYTSGVPARSVGSSRITALEHVKDVWVGAVGSLVGSLLPPAVVLLITQLGVLVGYQYFQRRSKTGIDGKDFS